MRRVGKPQPVGTDSTGLSWFKSSASGPNPTETLCVEVAHRTSEVLVRSSRNRQGQVLVFPRQSWEAFMAGRVTGQ
ncbi:DUF397 domain-containing protein [Saccharothrix luteola]|uniref:DUF397 domain-containing protein n=1 Tax=Saccharothrix luteola TaxID=2893018 RepID=UPI001E4F46D8|nr:DUF397 domain-containing protein [Saccharothrix luteola]MCC8249519.1 DUF397 domain-containing protein [Saccharothrix luteola]